MNKFAAKSFIRKSGPYFAKVSQDEIAFAEKHSLLTGLRYDHDKRHGNIFTSKAAYK